jgi:SMC interacting uncharacterized protein involved in chromosome segregation
MNTEQITLMKAIIQQSSGIERLTKQVKDAEKLADASMIELEDLQNQYQETLAQLVISLQP